MSWKSVKLQGEVDPGDDPPLARTDQRIHGPRRRSFKTARMDGDRKFGKKAELSTAGGAAVPPAVEDLGDAECSQEVWENLHPSSHLSVV